MELALLAANQSYAGVVEASDKAVYQLPVPATAGPASGSPVQPADMR